MNGETLIYGVLAALIAGLFSGLGGLLLYLRHRYSTQQINMLLNAAAGIMLSSAVFNLLAPAVNGIEQLETSRLAAANLVISALLCGVGLIWLLHIILPHQHESELIKQQNIINRRSALLFVFAIALHKFPEGLAIGVAYAGQQYFNPLSLVIGISLQNIPEGLMVATSLLAIGFRRSRAAGYASLSGLLQPAGAFTGILLTGFSQSLVPFGMALAGGTMLFVVINEVLPEIGQHNDEARGSLALLSGFMLMTYICIIMS